MSFAANSSEHSLIEMPFTGSALVLFTEICSRLKIVFWMLANGISMAKARIIAAANDMTYSDITCPTYGKLINQLLIFHSE